MVMSIKSKKDMHNIQRLPAREQAERRDRLRSLLFRYRLENGYTQKQLGSLISATQDQISKWEGGVYAPCKVREEQLWNYLTTVK